MFTFPISSLSVRGLMYASRNEYRSSLNCCFFVRILAACPLFVFLGFFNLPWSVLFDTKRVHSDFAGNNNMISIEKLSANRAVNKKCLC